MIVFVASAIGLWISCYFTGVFYKIISPNVFWIPKVCQFTEKSCLTVLDTPRAKMFGLPNSVFGIGMYTYLMIDAVFNVSLLFGLILIFFATLRSIYLAYSLIFVTKIPCPLCFTSHLLNLFLLVIYTQKVIF